MSENLPPVLHWEYKRTDDPVRGVEDLTFGHATYDTNAVEVERDAARQVLQDIREAIDERSKYHYIQEIVLGVEPYIDADVYCRCAYEEPLQRVLDPRVIVVPGDAIEPVIPFEKRVEEHLFDEEEDDG